MIEPRFEGHIVPLLGVGYGGTRAASISRDPPGVNMSICTTLVQIEYETHTRRDPSWFSISEPTNVKILKELWFSPTSVQIDLSPGTQDPVIPEACIIPFRLINHSPPNTFAQIKPRDPRDPPRPFVDAVLTQRIQIIEQQRSGVESRLAATLEHSGHLVYVEKNKKKVYASEFIDQLLF